MQCVTEERVEETWSTVSQLPPEKIVESMLEFSESQPHLLGFVMVFAEDLDEEDAKELSTYMLYVIYQMFVDSSDIPVPQITEDQIKAQYEATCDMLDNLHDDEEHIDMEIHNQPFIYKYVSETLFEDSSKDEEDLKISEDNAGEVFMLMKCVIDAIDSATD